MGDTKQNPGEKILNLPREKGGGVEIGEESFQRICLLLLYLFDISSKVLIIVKGGLMCYLGGRKREDALDDLPTSEFLNIGQSTYSIKVLNLG